MLIANLGSLTFVLSFFLNFIYYIAFFFIEQKSSISGVFHKSFGFLINSLLICSFLMFILCFAYSDFSLYSVFINSHTAKPLVYKVGAAWGSHEGSVLFWLFILSVYNLFYYFSKKEITNFLALHFLSFFLLILQGFVYITVDPFKRSNLIPNEGNGFNPLLQDYALLIHPPILYLGYAGNLISFAIAVASVFKKKKDCHHQGPQDSYSTQHSCHSALDVGSLKDLKDPELLQDKKNANWYQEAKTWILIPWSFLTLGIGLGSWWSYRELGWGGFWAWDPVENVSLLPWLAGLTFIHLSLIKNKTSLIHYLLKLNCVLIFIFSLFATFIVRSGIISSIHAFATSNERGWYFLVLLGIFSIIGIGSIVFFGNDTNTSYVKNNKNKISDILLKTSSFLFISAYLLIIFAIIVPIYLNIYHHEIVNIGENFYRNSFGILFIPILGLMCIVPFLDKETLYTSSKESLKNDGLIAKIWLKIRIIMILLFLGLVFFTIKNNDNHIALINIFFISFIIFSYSILTIQKIFKKQKINIASFLGHCGISLMILGAITCTLNDTSTEQLMDTDQHKEIKIGNYKALLNKVTPIENNDFVGIKADFSIWYKNHELGHSYPEVKFYKIEKIQLPDSASFYHNLSDIYLLVTGVDGDKNMIMVKIYYKKYVALIWIGCLMIGISGFVKLFIKNNAK